MINNKSKTLQFILAGMMLVSVSTIGCNNGTEDKTETKVDTTVTKMQEAAPAVIDTVKVIDTAATRPIVPAN